MCNRFFHTLTESAKWHRMPRGRESDAADPGMMVSKLRKREKREMDRRALPRGSLRGSEAGRHRREIDSPCTAVLDALGLAPLAPNELRVEVDGSVGGCACGHLGSLPTLAMR